MSRGSYSPEERYFMWQDVLMTLWYVQCTGSFSGLLIVRIQADS